jgi:peptide/nickel transport system substrate-binding protein
MKRNFTELFLLLLLLAACTNSSRQENDEQSEKKKEGYLTFPDETKMMADWSRDNVLVIHTLSDAGYLHPTNYTFQNARLILSLTHPALLTIDQLKMGLAPCMSKELPVVAADEMQFTYSLLDEATWDDGSPVTAEDVIFTFKVAKFPLTDNPLHKSVCENLKTIVADLADPKRFTIVMKTKYVQAVSMVSDFPLLSRSFFDPENVLANYTVEQMDEPSFKPDQVPALSKWAAAFNDSKNGNDLQYFYGCGPYKVTGWESGQSVTLERKPNHWTGSLKGDNIYLKSYPEKIIFKAVKDENAAMLEFKSQQFDASTYLTSRVLLELQRDSNFNRNYHSVFLNSYSFTYMAMNMRPDGIKHKRILDDVRVRRAIALLTPVDRIIEVVALGCASRWPSMVSPLKKEFNNNLKLLNYDVAEASRLLDEAGWKDTDGDNIRDKVVDGERIPLQLELLSMVQGNMAKDLANMIVEAVYPGGIKIILKPVEGSVLRQMSTDHDFDLVLSSWAVSSLPQDFNQVWSTTSWANKGSNITGFGNAGSDALIDSIAVTLDESRRIPMVKRLQKIIYDEQPYVFLYSPDRKVVIHKRFGNVIMTAELPSFIPNNLLLLNTGAASMPSDMQ